jgi:uncharacterized protein (DUF2236 family)
LNTSRLPGERYDAPLGDKGYFGPDSITWKVHADPAMFIGGFAALILQTLHPLAMAGVAEHSDFKIRPLVRLSRTGSFLASTTYGPTEVANKAINIVTKMHKKVNGTAPDGRKYSALDPDLLTWVHACEVYCFVKANRRYSLNRISKNQIDQYLAEYSVIPIKLGATWVPKSYMELKSYFEEIKPELKATDEALDTIDFLFNPKPKSPAAVNLGYKTLLFGSVRIIPDWATSMLKMTKTPEIFGVGIETGAVWSMLNFLRFILQGNRIVEESIKRIESE